jgi:hypothetical protein
VKFPCELKEMREGDVRGKREVRKSMEVCGWHEDHTPRRNVRGGGRDPRFILNEFPNQSMEWGRISKRYA